MLSVAFGVDGNTVVTGSPGGALLWNVDLSSWRGIDCSVVGRCHGRQRQPYAPDLDGVRVSQKALRSEPSAFRWTAESDCSHCRGPALVQFDPCAVG